MSAQCWGLRNKTVDCARRRIRGRPLDGGSIPPISTIPNPGFRWKPGVFFAQERTLQRINGRGGPCRSAYSIRPCWVLVVIFAQHARTVTAAHWAIRVCALAALYQRFELMDAQNAPYSIALMAKIVGGTCAGYDAWKEPAVHRGPARARAPPSG